MRELAPSCCGTDSRVCMCMHFFFAAAPCAHAPRQCAQYCSHPASASPPSPAAQVVIGSHMSGGLMQFMLGSVASYVAHHCKQPVAVLH